MEWRTRGCTDERTCTTEMEVLIGILQLTFMQIHICLPAISFIQRPVPSWAIMTRFSDYARSPRPVHVADPEFDDPYDDPAQMRLDNHSYDPWYRRSSPENVPYNARLRPSASDIFMSERTDPRLSERCSRGYNPSYYGTASCKSMAYIFQDGKTTCLPAILFL